MKIEAVPLTAFVHGDIHATEGKVIEIDEFIAADLERAGLLRVKMAPRYANKMMAVPENKSGKVQAVGEAQPSSLLPAARASHPTTTQTLHLPARGPGRPRKIAT